MQYRIDSAHFATLAQILLVRRVYTHGLAIQKAKRYPVLSQLMALSETSKYSAAVVEMEEKVNH
jgi:hypothetical protein